MDMVNVTDLVGTWLKKSRRFMLYLFLQIMLMAIVRIIIAYS